MLELDEARVCGSQALRVTAQPRRLLGPENVPLDLAEQVKRWKGGGRGPGLWELTGWTQGSQAS